MTVRMLFWDHVPAGTIEVELEVKVSVSDLLGNGLDRAHVPAANHSSTRPYVVLSSLTLRTMTRQQTPQP